MGRRIRWLAVVMVLCFGLVLLQLVNIQFRKASALANSPYNPRNVVTQYDNNRGLILSDTGTVMAQSVPTHASSYADQFRRVYPYGSLFSQIVGYSSSYYGQSGVELQYDSYLGLHPPLRASSLSQFFSQILNPPPKTTDNVTLTLDPRLQQVAEQALAASAGKFKDGAVVAIRPTTGAILAMWSTPTFDPAPFAGTDVKTQQAAYFFDNQRDPEGFIPLRPMAFREFFPPGSTSKVVTSSGVYDLQPSLDNYSAPVVPCLTLPSTKTICNDAPTAALATPCGGTMAVMLPASCDPGYASLGMLLGGTFLAQQAQMFGYGQVPPLDLPGAIKSVFPTAVQFGPAGLGQSGVALASIGQGAVATTALQNALVAAGIANGGVVMTPHVLSQVHDAQGNLVTSYQPTPWLRATSAATAAQVTALMQAVVTHGTATGYISPSLNAAVKTGTAQTGRTDPTANTDDWMIGFAPSSGGTPQVAVAVVVPFQVQSSQGASVAGPIMNKVLAAALAESSGTGASVPPATTTTVTVPRALPSVSTTTRPGAKG